ncbi:hypothetical protein F5148DRAFT_787873 [Russula earlei]|uniref:Uncharacterized protein n=1 Tax=Russula earlei TaxID=71964 RepID=A0ACC0UBY2_9AGAM|nr:hypothetical protein F5148DRAFT_787873 [Russula earlei]
MASLSPNSSPNTPPSDESAMLELSFDYEQNSAGEWKRVSKGRSSPPTPVDKQSPPSTDLIPSPSGNPSPPHPTRLSLTRSESLPGIPSTIPPDRPDPVPPAQSALRSFQRALSGPVSLPQSGSQSSHTSAQPSSIHFRTLLAGGLRSSGRSAGGPRRVTLEEFNQMNEKLKIQQQQEQEEIDLKSQVAGLPQDDKENLDGSSLMPLDTAPGPSSIHRRYSPPRSAPALSDAHYSFLSSRYSAVGASSSNVRSTLADVVPVPQRPSLPIASSASSTRQLVAGPSRLSRVHSLGQKKFTPGLAIDKISEVDGADDALIAELAGSSEAAGGAEEWQYVRSQPPPTRQRVNALTHSGTRPRRSASLSDASTPERPVAPPLSSVASHSGARPGTSMGLTQSRTGATRVTLEEKRRRDREIALEDAEYARALQRREEEDVDPDRECP